MLYYVCSLFGGVGEVVNTPDCGSGMHGFDPHIPPHLENIAFICGFFIVDKKIIDFYWIIDIIMLEEVYYVY